MKNNYFDRPRVVLVHFPLISAPPNGLCAPCHVSSFVFRIGMSEFIVGYDQRWYWWLGIAIVRKESAITRPGRGLGNMNEIWDEEVADMRETQKLFKQAQAEYEAARETASSLSTRNRSNFSMTKNSKEEERLAYEHERFLEQKLARTETEYRKLPYLV